MAVAAVSAALRSLADSVAASPVSRWMAPRWSSEAASRLEMFARDVSTTATRSPGSSCSISDRAVTND